MENISFRILRICIYVYATELQTIQLLSVPNPCPDIAQTVTIADMCSTDFAYEEPNNGGATVDSVALRAMTQQDGCTCEVSLENHYNRYTVYIRKYDLRTSAAPEHEACGLAIDIDYTSPDNFPENKDAIECTKGINSRSVVLLQNGVLNFRSRIMGGNFSTGYCIQIYRPYTTGDKVRIQINCSRYNMQTTQHMTDTAIQDNTISDTDSTLYIAIGVGSGVVVIALILVVSFIIIRRKGKKHKNNTDVQPDKDSNDDDSDGLKYNCLYNTSEQQETMEGEYHTVELEGKQNSTEKQNIYADSSAVDGNYSSVEIVIMPAKDSSKTDNKIKSSSNTTPLSEIQRTEEDTSTNVKHVTPMADSNEEYAVVDKSGITGKKVKHISAPNDSNVEYAVIDKK